MRAGWALALASAVIVATAPPAPAQLDRLLRGLGGGPSDTKIASGLKEALQVGTEKTVGLTGRVDGYFANQAIKILMPERLRAFERGLRAEGYGAQVDEFVLGMNRAAERAAPFARHVFTDAIGQMSFDDARKIWSGSDTAATEYFKGKTTDRLTAAFTPVIDRALGEVGVTRQYKELVERFEAIPFVRRDSFDLTHYVTGKGLDGLFHVLAEQEKQIRTNPVARTTDLLKEVFGR
jgi:hypothetical protein